MRWITFTAAFALLIVHVINETRTPRLARSQRLCFRQRQTAGEMVNAFRQRVNALSTAHTQIDCVQNTECFLNANTGWALFLPPSQCVLIAMALLRMYVATAVREGKEEAEHAYDMSEYYKLYRAFGLEMQVDDYEQNA